MTPSTRVRVLVADDNDGIRETTVSILKGVGYEVTEAVDGQDAMEKLAAGDFDVAVIDVKMPKRDGVWVVENVDPVPPPPAFVMASAYNFDDEMRNRLGARVLDYLRKPIPPRDLIEAVGRAAERVRVVPRH